MSKKIILAIAIYLLQHSIFAQSKQPKGFYFFAGLGVNSNNFSNLNNHLRESNLPMIKPNSLTIPIRFAYVDNKMIALESNILEELMKQNNKGFTSVSQKVSLIHLGYDISRNKNFRLYPSIGIGSLKYSTEIGFKTSKNISFEDALEGNSAANRLRITNKSAIIDVGFEWQKLDLPIPLSIKTGYQFALNNTSNWASDMNLTNMPSDKLSNFYIKVFNGIGKGKK
jgi:hypothetical protein